MNNQEGRQLVQAKRPNWSSIRRLKFTNLTPFSPPNSSANRHLWPAGCRPRYIRRDPASGVTASPLYRATNPYEWLIHKCIARDALPQGSLIQRLCDIRPFGGKGWSEGLVTASMRRVRPGLVWLVHEEKTQINVFVIGFNYTFKQKFIYTFCNCKGMTNTSTFEVVTYTTEHYFGPYFLWSCP